MLQSFIPFLDKERYLTVCFFEFFSNRGSTRNTVSFFELQDNLEISSYNLQKVLSTAQNLCSQISGLKLEQARDKKITLTGLTTLKLKKNHFI